MKKDSLSKRTFSLDFKHQVLIDYYRSGSTKYFIEKKYGLHCGTMHRWEKAFVLSEKDLSLSDELLIRLSKMRQKKSPSLKRHAPHRASKKCRLKSFAYARLWNIPNFVMKL